MRCKDIEQLIIDSSDAQISKDEWNLVEQHLTHCDHCASFQKNLDEIRAHLETCPPQVLPDKLKEQTRALCLEEIRSSHSRRPEITPELTTPAIPKFIWAALTLIIILTGVVMIYLIGDFKWTEIFSFSNATVFTLILQNAAMLILAPILLRKCRQKNRNLQDASWNMNSI
jgi:hypothetical protein